MALTNAQMKPNRFAKLARGRRILRAMNACWDARGTVWFSTMTSRTPVRPKLRDCIRMDAEGSLYCQHGKRWDCIDYCRFGFEAPASKRRAA